MMIHVFAFRWKPQTTSAQKERVATEIGALQGVIPGILEWHVGTNISPRGQDYTFGGVMKFKDKEAFEAYNVHPAHQALLVWLLPLLEPPVELDLEV
jgi:hypothetical protein